MRTQSKRKETISLVCMSLEEIERSVSTATPQGETVLYLHQDCGDVTFLVLMETLQISTSTSAGVNHMVVNLNNYVSHSRIYTVIYCRATE